MTAQTESPSRRRHKAIQQDGAPPGRQRKKARTDSNNLVDIGIPGPFNIIDPALSATSPAASHLSQIQLEAHHNRLALQQNQDKGKGTDEAYPRHVQGYMRFWEADQDRRAKENPEFVRTPAHPLVGEKVALFLKYETERNKRNNKGQDISGTSVGKESIKQTISALQRYMHAHQHEPEYFNCSDTRIPLRSQDIVKVYEVSSSAMEPKRIQNAHILKSKGTTNDTYTTDKLVRMSTWTLRTFGPSKTQIHLGIRDRAMLLLSTTLAFRGNSSRLALLSDLFFRSIPMGIIGTDVKLQALGILADQSKTNVTGRVDEHGMFRHRLPELCGFGAMGFYLYSRFHILGEAPPNFAPDFNDPAHTEYGRRDWYKWALFPGKKKVDEAGESLAITDPMSYDNHYERVSIMHKQNNVSISKVTHGGRPYTAAVARENGAAAIDTKVLGKWKTGDAYSEVYDRGLPTNAMLGAAMFNVQHPESYVLARGLLEPPTELLLSIFPWIESKELAYKDRCTKYGPRAVDFALKNLLVLLMEFRKIILQDAAVLYAQYPDCRIWSHPPFNTELFQLFSSSGAEILAQAEIDTRQRLATLPDTVARSMEGILRTLHIEQRKDKSDLSFQINYVQGLILSQVTASKKGRISLSKSRSQTPFLTPHSSKPPDKNCIDLKGPPLPTPPPADHDCDTPLPANPLVKDNKWPSHLLSLQQSFRLSDHPMECDNQLALIQELADKYGIDRISNTCFEWVQYSGGPIREEWLPIYVYGKGLSITEAWQEWATGLHGKLSVRQLNEGWGARWRRNIQAQKTEASRRRHIIDLIIQISEKPNWNIPLALRFLEDKYGIPGPGYRASLNKFCKQLQNKTSGAETLKDILCSAASYCK